MSQQPPKCAARASGTRPPIGWHNIQSARRVFVARQEQSYQTKPKARSSDAMPQWEPPTTKGSLSLRSGARLKPRETPISSDLSLQWTEEGAPSSILRLPRGCWALNSGPPKEHQDSSLSHCSSPDTLILEMIYFKNSETRTRPIYLPGTETTGSLAELLKTQGDFEKTPRDRCENEERVWLPTCNPSALPRLGPKTLRAGWPTCRGMAPPTVV